MTTMTTMTGIKVTNNSRKNNDISSSSGSGSSSNKMEKETQPTAIGVGVGVGEKKRTTTTMINNNDDAHYCCNDVDNTKQRLQTPYDQQLRDGWIKTITMVTVTPSYNSMYYKQDEVNI